MSNFDEYRATLLKLHTLHKEMTDESFSIECETEAGRQTIAKAMFPDVEGTNQNYKLHGCFSIHGVWFTLSAQDITDEQSLEILALKQQIDSPILLNSKPSAQ